jgi:uncharacterized protein (TIGR02996 family)
VNFVAADAFLRAIAAEPDIDGTRLVFADWLDEHDRPDEAEFIRLQCDLARDRADTPDRRRKARRAAELRDAFDAERRQKDSPWLEWRHGRGLIEYVGVRSDDFLATAGDWFASIPLRGLWLATGGDLRAALAAIPVENCLRELDLAGNELDPAALADLAATPALAGVRDLGLTFAELGDTAIPILCGSPFFARLDGIQLGGNPFSDDGRRRLRDHFGMNKDFAWERHPDHLYAIDGEDGDFTAGFADADDTQELVLFGDHSLSRAVFDHEGNLLETVEEPVPPEAEEGYWEALDARRQFRPGVIRVKRFRFPDGVGITAVPPGWCRVLESAGSERHGIPDHLRVWLAGGSFRWEWRGSDWFLGRDGRVTAT